MLTQLARVGESRHIAVEAIHMSVTPTFASSGAILADTITNRLVSVETALEITSPAPREQIVTLVATAERMCFVLDAIEQPHTVHRSIMLNGAPLV